ncbi:MAG: ATP-dependent DNA helicase RecG [Clostridia bacterium]|nr:ATP-dependent DNA helicase RecG [Clostridia bacterium]
MAVNRDTPLRFIKGVGEATGNKLAKLGLITAGDLIEFFPRRYEYRDELYLLADAPLGDPCATVLTVCSAPSLRYGNKNISYVKVNACDQSGTATLTFFNQPWMEKSLVYGRKFRVWGKVERYGYSFQISSPEIEPYSEDLPKVLPIYPLTKGVNQQLIRRLVKAVEACIEEEHNPIPPEIIQAQGLMERNAAVRALHFPQNRESVEKAKRSLAFEELILFQLALRRVRGSVNRGLATAMSYKDTGIGKFFTALPFSLTNAQERVVKEVFADLCRETPMCRMVQGDVGCGKTVIAAAAMAFAVKNGLQCAMMAPTEILANQHFITLGKLFEGFGIELALLTGSTSAKEKRRIKSGLSEGSIQAVVGTNAIIQKDVEYKNLGLVITDEQHRFGVLQRAALADKSTIRQPHSLVMSATPIPRSLSLILYGDMDISIIDSLPPGRQVIETRCVGEEKRQAVYDFINKQIAKGRQAYIICPLVEDGEGTADDKKSVESYKALFAKALPNVSALCLHGRMKGKEKDEVMSAFERGEASVLISTTVVEVGVNVPNATVMLIENAECFGLSQLHQLRGRVGRGDHKSFCIMLTDKASARLEVLCETTDGFKIAEADLAARGPGDFFGARQSGDARFAHASSADIPLIETTRNLAASLEKHPSPVLEEAVRRYLGGLGSENIFN